MGIAWNPAEGQWEEVVDRNILEDEDSTRQRHERIMNGLADLGVKTTDLPTPRFAPGDVLEGKTAKEHPAYQIRVKRIWFSPWNVSVSSLPPSRDALRAGIWYSGQYAFAHGGEMTERSSSLVPSERVHPVHAAAARTEAYVRREAAEK